MSLSVYKLINELCESLVKDCDGIGVRKARDIAFSTLLFGAPAENIDENGNNQIVQSENLLEELEFVRFEIFMKHRHQKDVLEYVDNELDKFIEVYNKNEDQMESITKFLLLLRNTDQMDHLPVKRNFFQLSQFPKNSKDNPYMQGLFDKSNSLLALSVDKFKNLQDNKNDPNNNSPKFFSECITSAINRRKALPAIVAKPPKEIKFEYKTNEEIIMENFELFCEKYLNHKKVLTGTTNWEHLGLTAIFKEEPYLTECDESNTILHLLAVLNESRNDPFNAYLIPTDDFIWEVRYLNVGIQSNSFKLNDQMAFEMQKNVTIENVSPATMAAVMKQFLECGTCYKRLKLMISKNPYNYKLLFDGVVYKAFCYTIDKYLDNYQKIIFNLQVTSLTDFAVKTADMRRVLINLCKFLKIHPDVIGNNVFPVGSDFLTYLYKELIRVTETDTRSLYIVILKTCCDVYFNCFQKWIFQGYLDNSDQELFIYYVDHYRPNTKYFFDKAYLIRKKSVPGFLQGFEEDILLCGKYTMLLKSFKPMHPLFSIEAIPVDACLCHEELQQLKHQCARYIKMAREKCGPPIFVEDMLKEKQKRKVHFQKLAELNAKKNLEKWQSEQELRASELSIFKKQQLMELKQQMLEIEEKKMRQRLKSIELDKKYLEEVERLETERLNQENEERLKRIEHYQELNRMVEEKKLHYEKLMAELKDQDDEDEIDTLQIEIPKKTGDDQMAMSITSDKFTPDEFHPSQSPVPELSKSTESLEVQEDVVNESFKQEQQVRKYTMKKSQSDILNSNELPSEFQTNRERAFGSAITKVLTQDDNMNSVEQSDELTDAQKNKLKVLSHELNLFEMPTGSENTTLTDAQKIKKKILAREFDLEYDAGNIEKTPQIVIENVENMTDLQKNRQKILSHEFGIEAVEVKQKFSDPDSEFTRNKQKILGQTIFTDGFLNNERKLTLNLDVETDRARNKRRILQSEYNIVTNLPDYSPMSIGSDIVADDKELKLKISEPFAGEARFGVPNTAIIMEKTPESGLNIDTKDGFHFPDPNESNRSSFLDLNFPKCLESDDEMYREFMDAVLKVRPEFFKLPSSEVEIRKENKEFELMEFFKKHEEIKFIDIVGLTKLIQMSLIIPMNAHLEVVNNEILRTYLVDLDILGHFKSLRNYFFMMDGEFGTNICHGLQKKLEQKATPKELLNYHSLHFILSNAIASSIYCNDPNVERLSFIVQNIPDEFEFSSPNVLQLLSLSYKVEWPLNLILNPETLAQYANIFKYLVKVKRISWALNETFQMLKECIKNHGNDLLRSHEYRHVQLIRHKMVHFIHVLENHITRSAFQMSWKNFLEDLKTARSMEDLYRKHTTYLKRVLFLCLLNKNSAEYSKNVEEIFKVVLKFHKYLKIGDWIKSDKSKEYYHSKYSKMVESEVNFEKLIKYMLYLGGKIAKHNQQEIGEFTYLININQYYTKDNL